MPPLRGVADTSAFYTSLIVSVNNNGSTEVFQLFHRVEAYRCNKLSVFAFQQLHLGVVSLEALEEGEDSPIPVDFVSELLDGSLHVRSYENATAFPGDEYFYGVPSQSNLLFFHVLLFPPYLFLSSRRWTLREVLCVLNELFILYHIYVNLANFIKNPLFNSIFSYFKTFWFNMTVLYKNNTS